MNWEKHEEWKKRGKGFMVEVKHWKRDPILDPIMRNGGNKWNVYAYIYPTHPHFQNFSGAAMFQDAANALPFHGGPTYLRVHWEDDASKITCYQVGSDYEHLYDEQFSFCETEEHADTQFRDAEELFTWLENAATETEMIDP